nr:9564_t:CDS:2 [Entrophospora candida]
MSTKLYNKIYGFLTTAEEKKINAISIAYLGMKEDCWVEKNELKAVVESAVTSASNVFVEGSDQIEKNIRELKRKLQQETIALYQRLYSDINKIPIQELTWKDPLADQIIKDDSNIIQKLPGNLKKAFMKLVRLMKPNHIPKVENICEEFISKFIPEKSSTLPCGLVHAGDWKENGGELEVITLRILETLRSIWYDPAFRSEFVVTMNEGTYVNNVITPLINACLFNNPFGESAFITTFERQIIASADRRGDGKVGRRPDIMFTSKEEYKYYELMYTECSRITCTDQKEENDNIKLWRECNDGIYWAHKSHRLEKGQFGIIGMQVAGRKLCLNVLIRDEVEVHRYYKLHETEIPIRYTNNSSI